MKVLPVMTEIHRWSCLGNELTLKIYRDSRRHHAADLYSLTIMRGIALRNFKAGLDVRCALGLAIEEIEKNPNAAAKFTLSDESDKSLMLTCEPPKFLLGGDKGPAVHISHLRGFDAVLRDGQESDPNLIRQRAATIPIGFSRKIF